MLKIGEFAQICGVTVRTLRYYDEIGLLAPSHVDAWTGYRYYTRDQVTQLNLILTLKDLGMSLEQIDPMLRDWGPNKICEMLKLKEVELEDRVRKTEQQLIRVRAWLGQIEEMSISTRDETKQEIVMMMAENRYPKVMLEGAIKAFERIEREIKYWQPRSWVQAQMICMYTAGWDDIDYETIMMISGFGPSFAYHPKELWWAQYLPPQGCDGRIAQMTGFGYEGNWYETVETYWRALKETIDAGKPIHAPYIEEVILIGYQDADNEVDRRIKPLAPLGIEPNTWWTWDQFRVWFAQESHGFLGHHTERVEQIPRMEAAITVLETIVRMAYSDPRAENPDFAGVRWGLDGLKAYATDVGDISKSGKPDEYFYSGWMGCHAIYPQISGRASAAVFLKRLSEAGIFQEEVNAKIMAAADEYHAVRAAWGEYERHLGNEETADASDSWMKNDHRLAGAAAIRQAIEHEENAISRIQQALMVIQQ